MIPRDKINDCLKEMMQFIRDFLKAKGGYDNGYTTYVHGSINPLHHSGGEFKFKLPSHLLENLTMLEYAKICHKLQKDLDEISSKYGGLDDNQTIKIYEIYQEDGCFKMGITYSVSHEFKMNW